MLLGYLLYYLLNILLLSLVITPALCFNIPNFERNASLIFPRDYYDQHYQLKLDNLSPEIISHILNHLESRYQTGTSSLTISISNNNMTTVTEVDVNVEPNSLGWHPGEIAAHKLLKVSTWLRHNPTQPGLSLSHGYRVAESPVVALGIVDSRGHVWTSLFGGERGFARPVARNVLALQSLVFDDGGDPFVGALRELESADGDRGDVIKPGGNGKVISGLSLDLENRDRVKLAGRLLVASLDGKGKGEEENERKGGVKEIQIAMAVDEGLGNCPKYMNRKEIRAHLPNTPELVVFKQGVRLSDEALGLIGKADMMFLSSTNGKTMDTNHRGGPAGFIRVLRNDDGEEGVVLVYPEYSGNQLYQSLGNLQVDPRVGVVIPDYETSDVLYLTGETELLVGAEAATVMPHSRVAVKIKVKEARFVKDGLPFRGTSLEASPYNPPVRRLATEGPPGVAGESGGGPAATATLVKKDILSPTIARFTFQLYPGKERQHLPAWKPGQHVTLDFSGELDQGWSHMREDDPQSLNDDFVRTFTVSNRLPEDLLEVGSEKEGVELEITVRRHGPATGFLWSHLFQVPVELPVLGFGGEESFRIPIVTGGKRSVFVAGGVGITPLLTQAPRLLKADVDLVLLWSLRAQDLGLVVDSFERIPGLAERTRLFITGTTGTGGDGDADKTQDEIDRVKSLGVQSFVSRRLLREDLLAAKNPEIGSRFYLCAGAGMQSIVEGWLQGEEFVSESFNY